MRILYVQNPENLSEFFKTGKRVSSDTHVISTGRRIGETKVNSVPVIDPNEQTVNQAKDEVKRDNHNNEDIIPIKTSIKRRKTFPASSNAKRAREVKTTPKKKKKILPTTFLSS